MSQGILLPGGIAARVRILIDERSVYPLDGVLISRLNKFLIRIHTTIVYRNLHYDEAVETNGFGMTLTDQILGTLRAKFSTAVASARGAVIFGIGLGGVTASVASVPTRNPPD